jgi:tape measure domain-containing protein
VAQALEFEAKVSARELNSLLDELRRQGEGAAKALNDALGGTVTKKLVLETVTDANGVKRQVAVEKERLSVVDSILNTENKLNKAKAGSLTSLRGQLREATQVRDSIARTVTGVDQYNRKIREGNPLWAQANAKVQAINRELNIAASSNFWQRLKAEANLGGLVSFGNGLTQITMALASATILVGQFTGAINSVVRAAAEVQEIGLTFRAIGQGALGGVTALQESARLASGLGVSLDTVQDGFRQLSPVILKSGGALTDVSDITESLSSRFVAFGISGDRARRVMNGVIQAFAKGKLMAEELTQQISEADPAFKTDLAGALNVTVAELEALVKAGEITTDVLIDVLPKLSKSSILFGKLGTSAGDAVGALERQAVTIDQVRAKLEVLGKLNLRDFAQLATPLIQGFLEVQAIVTDLIGDLLKLSISKSFVDILALGVDVAKQLLEAFGVLARAAATVASGIAPILDLLLKIPGLAQVIAVALAGKLLSGLDTAGGRFKVLSNAVKSFKEAVRDTFSVAKQETYGYSAAIQDAIKSADKAALPDLADGVANQAEQATKSVATANASMTKTSVGALKTLRAEYAKALQEATAAQAGTNGPNENYAKLLTRQLSDAKNELRGIEEQILKTGQEGGASVLDQKVKELRGAARDLNKEIDRLSSELDDRAIASAGVEQARERIESLRTAVTETNKALINTFDRPFSIVFDGLDQAKATVFDLQDAFDDLNRLQAEGAEDEIARLQQVKEERLSVLDDVEKRLNTLRETGDPLGEVGRELEERGATLRTEISDIGGEIRSLGGAAYATGERNKELSSSLMTLSDASATAGQRQVALRRIVGSLELEISNYTKEMDGARQSLSGLAEEQKRLQQATTRAPGQPKGGNYDADVESLKQVNTQIQALRDKTEDLSRARDSATSIQKALTKATDDGGRALDGVGVKMVATAAATEKLADRVTSLGTIGTGLRKLGGGFIGNIKKGFNDLAESLGLLEIAFIAVGIASTAYASYNREVAESAKLSQQRVDALRDSLKDVTGTDVTLPDAPEGLSNTWNRLGATVASVVDLVNEAFGSMNSGARKADGSLGSLLANLSGITIGLVGVGAAAALAGKAIAVALGLTVGAPILLTIAAIAAGLVLITNFGDGAAIAQQKVVRNAKEIADGYREQGAAATELAAALKRKNEEQNRTRAESGADGGDGPQPLTDAEDFAAAQALTEEYLRREKVVENLKKAEAGLRTEIKALPPEVREIAKSYMEAGNSLTAGISGAAAVGEVAEKLKISREEARELINEFVNLNGKIAKTVENLKAESTGLDQLGTDARTAAAAVGGLSPEQLKVARTASIMSEELKDAQDKLSNLDPNIKPQEWQAAADDVAALTLQAQRLKDLEDLRISLKIAAEIDSGLRSGGIPKTISIIQQRLAALNTVKTKVEVDSSQFADVVKQIAYIERELERIEQKEAFVKVQLLLEDLATGQVELSLQNIQQAVAGLEARVTQLDIDSPELPKVIGLLIQTQSLADAINGKKAQITVELIEKAGKGGDLSNTLNEISRYMSALEERKATLSVDSSQIDGVIRKIEQARMVQEQGAKSTQQLRDDISQSYWQKEIQNIQRAEQQEQTRHQTKMRALQNELRLIDDQVEAYKKATDAAVRALQASIRDPSTGPAAQALARYQRGQLEEQARSGDVGERLAAQAQLEALGYAEERAAKEKEIAALQERQRLLDEAAAIEKKKIEEQMRKAEEERQKASEAAQARMLELQEAITKLTEKQALAMIEIAKALVALRGGGGGAAAPAQTSGGQSSTQSSGGDPETLAKLEKLEGQVKAVASAYNQAGTSATTFAEISKSGASQASSAFSIDQSTTPSVLPPDTVARMAEYGRQAGGSFREAFMIATQSNDGGAAQNFMFIQTAMQGYQLSVDNLAAAQQRQVAAQNALNTAIASGASSGIIQVLRSQVAAAGAQVDTFSRQVAEGKQAIDLLNQTQLDFGGDEGFPSLDPVLEDVSALQSAFTSAGSSAISFAANLQEAANTDVGGDLDEAATKASDLASEAATAATNIGRAASDASDLQQGTGESQESMEGAREASQGVSESIDTATTATGELSEATQGTVDKMESATDYGESLVSELADAAVEARRIDDNIKSLDGTTITIRVNVVPARWTGGDVDAGKMYQVNELGQEGFLSAGGTLSPIRRPRSGLWRAPARGTVIPAHIWKDINAPTGRVGATMQPPAPGRSRDPINSALKGLVGALANRQQPQPELREMAAVQAEQAIQIGKLSRAIEDLTRKDWNMRVNVRNPRNGALIDSINRRL